MTLIEKFLIGVLLGISITLLVVHAYAHEAQSGWTYPYECCTGIDCRPLPRSALKETRNGYELPNGEVIPYNDKRIRVSKDKDFHWCTVLGSDTGRTLCFFRPGAGV